MDHQMIPDERGRRRRGQGRARIPESNILIRYIIIKGHQVLINTYSYDKQGPQRMRGRRGIHPRRVQRANRRRGQVPRGLVAEAWAEFYAELSEDNEGTSKRIKI